jgi:hypothetical protein
MARFLNTPTETHTWRIGQTDLTIATLCSGLDMKTKKSKAIKEKPLSKAALKRARKEGRITQY